MRYVILTIFAGLALTLCAPAPVAQDMEPVFYMTQYKIDGARLDSLETLVKDFDVPFQAFIAENVEGYQRWFFRHDTGNEYNFMIITRYPDWDMVRGDEIPFSDLLPQFVESMGMTPEELSSLSVEDQFEWAYEGSTHIDQIWRPVEAADDDN